MGTKVIYEVDPFNRLIIKNKPGKKSRVKKFRQVVYGKFGVSGDNALFYEVNKSQGIDVPQKIKFSGKYSLDNDRDFIITLDKWNNQCEGNRLTLKAKIIDAKSDEIVLLINSKPSENRSSTYIMKFYGSWQADKHNRLTFGVEKENNKADALTLSGAWEINKNNEIVYRHGEDGQAITFKGYWDIQDRCRLRYVLDKKTNSGLGFRTSLGTLAPKDKETYITFDIGIGVSRPERAHRKIVFSGRWKISKDKELILETPDAEKAGMLLRFTKEMFDRQAIAYIESIIRDKERFVGGGMTFRW